MFTKIHRNVLLLYYIISHIPALMRCCSFQSWLCMCAILWLVVSWVSRPQWPSIKDLNLHFPNILSTEACDGQLGRVFVCWVGIQSLMSLCLCQCARFASSAWWTFLWLTQLCRGHHTHTHKRLRIHTKAHTERLHHGFAAAPPSIATILSWWSHFSLTHSQLKASTHALCRSAFTTAPSHIHTDIKQSLYFIFILWWSLMNMCKFYEWKRHLKGRIWFAPFRKNS